MDIDEIQLNCEESMEKAVDYLKHELRGVRTGRATPAIVEYVKVDCYGSMTDLRSLALVSVPEPTQLLIKPFDPGTKEAIKKGIESAGLGLNPMVEGKMIRINIPPLTGDRRNQLLGNVKKMAEQAKVAIRNARRDANKHIDQAGKDKSLHLSEDVVESSKTDIQELTKKYEAQVDEEVTHKEKELMEI